MNSNLKVYDEKMNKSVDILAKDYAAIRPAVPTLPYWTR